jgi:hypothetical protein
LVVWCHLVDGYEVSAARADGSTRSHRQRAPWIHPLTRMALTAHRFINSFAGNFGFKTFSAVSTPAMGNALASINPS